MTGIGGGGGEGGDFVYYLGVVVVVVTFWENYRSNSMMEINIMDNRELLTWWTIDINLSINWCVVVVVVVLLLSCLVGFVGQKAKTGD